MASKSKIHRQKKCERIVNKYADQRRELKLIVKNKDLPMNERIKAMFQLDALPKLSSKVKLNNRCFITGNTRGYSRFFGLSRHALKRECSRGRVPGVYRASW